MENANVAFYDQVWLRDWQDMERLNPTARHLQRMIVNIVRRCQPVSSIVDVGCGMGVNIKSLVESFPALDVTGTDLSSSILEIARKYVGGPSPRVHFAVLDLGKGAINGRFDLVLCNQVLEHIEDDIAGIRNLDRMCKRYLLITVPGGKFNSTSRLVGHFRHYSKQELLDKVLPFGYRTIIIREWGFPFHSIYKTLLGAMPQATQRAVGLGKYGPGKRFISEMLYFSFFGNLADKGANVILLAEKVK